MDDLTSVLSSVSQQDSLQPQRHIALLQPLGGHVHSAQVVLSHSHPPVVKIIQGGAKLSQPEPYDVHASSVVLGRQATGKDDVIALVHIDGLGRDDDAEIGV